MVENYYKSKVSKKRLLLVSTRPQESSSTALLDAGVSVIRIYPLFSVSFQFHVPLPGQRALVTTSITLRLPMRLGCTSTFDTTRDFSAS